MQEQEVQGTSMFRSRCAGEGAEVEGARTRRVGPLHAGVVVGVQE